MSTIFEAFHKDADEHRDNIHIAYFTTERVARECAAEVCTQWPTATPPSGAIPVKVFETVQQWRDDKRAQLRQSAARKLTSAERDALGI